MRPSAERTNDMPLLNLTDRFVANCKPKDGKQTDFFDAHTSGLSLRVSKNGKRTWSLVFTAPRGTRARLTLGHYPQTSLVSARTLATEALGLLDEAKDPRTMVSPQAAATVTVALLCESYLEKHVRPNLRTAGNFEQRLKKNVLPLIGPVRLVDLHKRDINRVVDGVLRRGSKIEANRTFEALRAMLNWAMRRGDLDRNPMAGMTKPAQENSSKERFLNDDEIRHMWNALPQALAQSKACQRIIKLQLLTGQRVGEVAGMRRDELDLVKAIWSLPGSRTKNASAHTVPLSKSSLEVIVQALNDAGERAQFVFPSPATEGDGDTEERSINPHAVGRTLLRAHEPTKQHPEGRFGMVPFSSHDLRRTCLTHLAQLGVAPITIATVANHRSVTKAGVTFANYVHYDYQREVRAALEQWAERLVGIVEGGAQVVSILPNKAA